MATINTNHLRDRLQAQTDILQTELSRDDWNLFTVNETVIALQAIIDEACARTARNELVSKMLLDMRGL